ncbi:hypothetical protein ROHU_025724 [Labeo rohita]|uniref:Uncharacterized protein n=1 Tax=Labeo rohita TaxID=84645 RepID=A0A498MJ89_LABRO|nr:hypothetical protein ROHU_025724 [Labeo rohita]
MTLQLKLPPQKELEQALEQTLRISGMERILEGTLNTPRLEQAPEWTLRTPGLEQIPWHTPGPTKQEA